MVRLPGLVGKLDINSLTQATAETVDLGPVHPPKEDSITAFEQILPELKKTLVHLRHDYNKHEPEYFAAAEHLSDQDLVGFSADDFEAVRVATSAYGIHLFGKLRIPALPDPSGPSYIHFRVFIGGGGEPPKLHSIHTEEREDSSGGKTYRAIFTKNDELEWFDT
ncbi:uncharacterized protein FFB20_15721 [Fusarium fujikuroi]|uniref:Uncharacterized protein n=1 Tax=Fusarium fujikuroi TaxID=5127 RepID=A0A2H3RCH9_FUSFU|nr:uncharacterized protein Y057_14315 [Fusarium fujikuroi]KLP07514.1 uncharacterized protein LW94_9434 [Fusarium fujikuroi]QGI75619.1 hypothetical protein CEK25_000525 [Fusarium fujikuroi]QGI89311.1 hypothetical protein CEK26_000526 [Fusarium fujikuroi]SCN68444.1 uncharacterized protein FFE2_01631 [Fusarium fujikuroi]